MFHDFFWTIPDLRGVLQFIFLPTIISRRVNINWEPSKLQERTIESLLTSLPTTMCFKGGLHLTKLAWCIDLDGLQCSTSTDVDTNVDPRKLEVLFQDPALYNIK